AITDLLNVGGAVVTVAVSSIGWSTKFGPDSEPEKFVTWAWLVRTWVMATVASRVASKVTTARLVPELASYSVRAPRSAAGSVSVIDAGIVPVWASAVPLPSVTARFQPPAGIENPAGTTSAIATSNAPRIPEPVLVTTTANVTVSPASTRLRFESTGAVASAVDVSDPPLKRVPALPGADQEIPAGPTWAGENVPAGLSVATTPLVISRTGWVRLTWTMTSWLTTSSGEFALDSRAWLVSSSPSANGWSLATTVINRSMVRPVVPGALW